MISVDVSGLGGSKKAPGGNSDALRELVLGSYRDNVKKGLVQPSR